VKESPQASSTDDYSPVSSTPTQSDADPQIPKDPATSGPLPKIVSAACSARVRDGQGYLDLSWKALNATEGEVIVNGDTQDIDPASGHQSMAANFGSANVKFVFTNSNGAVSRMLYSDVMQSTERQEPSNAASSTPQSSSQSTGQPQILGFSVTIDDSGGQAKWNVNNADRIQISINGKVCVDVPNEIGTANIAGLFQGSLITLTAFNGNQRVEKSATATGVYQYGSVGQ
jgi:hypothetical protein